MYQDQAIKQSLAKFIPPQCLNHYPEYKEQLTHFLCVTCEYSEDADEVPDYVVHTRDSQTQQITGTTLYICESFAKMLYAPDMDPAAVDLAKPSQAFDKCGFLKFTDLVTYSYESFGSQHTTTADAFFNSVGFKSALMNGYTNFNVAVRSNSDQDFDGINCLHMEYSTSGAISLMVAAASSLLFVALV